MASEMGLTQQNVAGSVLVSLSSTSQTAPNYWVNPKNRVNYVLAVQTPPDRIGTDRGDDEHADHERREPARRSSSPGIARPDAWTDQPQLAEQPGRACAARSPSRS